MKGAVLHLAGPAYTSQEQPGAYVRRLEAACQLLHEGLRPSQATGAQPASFGPAAHNAPPAAPPTPSAGASTSAEGLCTLLLTDQEVLDVVLGLHDIRTAQLCHLLPWPGSHPLKLHPPSKALAQQLSQSQRSVPGGQLLAFVKTLERDSSLKVRGLVCGMENTLQGEALLRVWDSMHHAMLLVLAALQSLPIRPHPQHLDLAATTHTSTTQLPPGYHRCSACLLLSLRLVLNLAQHCVEQPLDKDLALARLYATLPGLLLGLSTTLTVMQAAGHPEAQAQRVQFVRCLLHLGPAVASIMVKTDPKPSGNSSSRSPGSSRGQASSRGPHGDTGQSCASQCVGDELHALAIKSYIYLAQAFCDVLGRKEEAFAHEELITTCQEEGPGSIGELDRDVFAFGRTTLMVTFHRAINQLQSATNAVNASSCINARVAASRHPAAAVSVPLLVSDILRLLALCLPGFQAAVVALKFCVAVPTVNESEDVIQELLEHFLTHHFHSYFALRMAVEKLMVIMPDWRRRPAVLRAGLRVATTGALAYNTMVSLLPDVEHVNIMPHTNSAPSLLPATVQRLSKKKKYLSDVSFHATHVWSLLLAQDGVNEPPMDPLNDILNDTSIHRITIDRVAVLPSPSLPQLAPLALDLVLGMENMLQMVMRQQDMVWKWPFWNEGTLVRSLADGYRTLLALFGHVIEVLVTPSVVGPAGLAAQPASWLPCGNSLVEGWCTGLLAGVCKLMYIDTPAATAVPVLLKIKLKRRLQGSYKLLLRGQRQAPSSMSPEAERLLSCLTLVLTAMLPQDLCLALADGMPNTGLAKVLVKENTTMSTALSKLELEQVWTWQALAAGTPAESTLQGLLPALASLYQLQGLVTPIAPGWHHQRLTLALGEWHES